MKIGDAASPHNPTESKMLTPPPMIVVPPAATPPPLKKSPLPPIRMKPPLNPHKDFRRG
ncbi:MAG: hypothetical protein JF609_03605 [Verrucomicrobia bacterium]|nr:hypothetical protein [Verrucomicrobiota bacterium]